MPWLTERQGCCPLCKRSVLGPDDEDSDYEDENRDVETGVELVNQGQPVPNEEYTESRNGDETEEPVSSDETGTGMMESEIQIQPSSPSPSDDALEVTMPVEPVSNVTIIEEQNADHVGEEVASIVEEPEIQVEPLATSKDSSDIDSGAAATVAEVNDPGQAHEKSETQDQNTRSELHSLV
jgi:cytoskeletal protein RodZ